ncbi:zinc finger BED domain-containing protein RICESLEEPER 2-like [Senna tora]|uniref:Zinc finger BED domain-containing protein RICESLEEPER 2-like n=1 Tax=Senna tora TaxID=362788 RepID=A0A835CHH6_9FABA|nr:zinc finger BED domain-containing protein RICESLEEPER 2-like [Senna tora]
MAWEERGSCLNIFSTTNRDRISETFTNYEAKQLFRMMWSAAPYPKTSAHNSIEMVLSDLEYIKKHSEGAIVVAIQFCKIKEYNGSKTLSNSMYASRMFINADIDEIREFHNGLQPHELNSPVKPNRVNSAITASPLESAFAGWSLSKTQDLFHAGDVSTVHVILASVLSINSDRGWYKIEMTVLDDDGTTNIIVFDRDAFDFLGISAMDLRKEHFQNVDDTQQLPERFDSFHGKKFFFKVAVKGSTWNGPPSITVQKMTNDPALIEKFKMLAMDKNIDLSSVDDGLIMPVQPKSTLLNTMDARRLSFDESYPSTSSGNSKSSKRASTVLDHVPTGSNDGDSVADVSQAQNPSRNCIASNGLHSPGAPGGATQRLQQMEGSQSLENKEEAGSSSPLATPKREQTFREAVRQLKISSTKKLILDVKTRGNSTYLMLNVALIYKDAFNQLKARESLYTFAPTENDWELAKEICGRLGLFSRVTEMFSGTQYPTTNLFFPLMCEIRLSLQNRLSSSIGTISNMASKMMTKFEKYWSTVHGVMGVAIVLDPRYKLKLVEYFFPHFYGNSSEMEMEKIKRLCYSLFYEYEAKSAKDETLREKSDELEPQNDDVGDILKGL